MRIDVDSLKQRAHRPESAIKNIREKHYEQLA
jgi:predicted ATP-grasp superfamily ATP-dependent carboligase